MNIPDAPPALAPLLRRLLAEAQVEVTQHEYRPSVDAWYAGLVLPGPGGGLLGGGDLGPFASAEDAIVRLVGWLSERYDETRAECDAAEAEAQQLRAELAAFRAEARAALALLAKLGYGNDSCKNGPQGLHARAFQARQAWAPVETGFVAGSEQLTCQRSRLLWHTGA